jgi:hypothetical protein
MVPANSIGGMLVNRVYSLPPGGTKRIAPRAPDEARVASDIE